MPHAWSGSGRRMDTMVSMDTNRIPDLCIHLYLEYLTRLSIHERIPAGCKYLHTLLVFSIQLNSCTRQVHMWHVRHIYKLHVVQTRSSAAHVSKPFFERLVELEASSPTHLLHRCRCCRCSPRRMLCQHQSRSQSRMQPHCHRTQVHPTCPCKPVGPLVHKVS